MGAECQKCISTQLEILPRELHEGQNKSSLQTSKEIGNTKTTLPTVSPKYDQRPQFYHKRSQREPQRVESESPTANFKDPKENVPKGQIESDIQEGLEQLYEGNSVLYELPKEGDLTSKIFTMPSGKNMTLQKKISKTSNLSQNPERHHNSLRGTYKSIRELQNSQDFQLLDPAGSPDIRGTIRNS